MATPQQFAAQLRTWNRQIPHKVAMVTGKAVMDTTNGAKVLAPVDTGFLRGSITGNWEVSGTHVTGHVQAGASYARFVENGTRYMAPQPFMGPAFEKVVPKYLTAMGRLGAMQG